MSRLLQSHMARWLPLVGLTLVLAQGAGPAWPQTPAKNNADPRVLSLATDGESVIDVPVLRGQLTHVVLPAGESAVIPPATGQGARCDDESHAWCIVTQGRDLFIKAKSGARTNNLIVVTERRRLAFELRVVERGGLMRLTLVPPVVQGPRADPLIHDATSSAAGTVESAAPRAAARPPGLGPVAQMLLQERLRAAPIPRNAQYSMAIGKSSDDIAPSLVFDDGRFTYLRFPGNRPLPTLFQVGPDGSEEAVNVRMAEDDLLVADRVARKLMLRLGKSVVAVVNDAYDALGLTATDGTTVPGVVRALSQAPRLIDPPPAVVKPLGGAQARAASERLGGAQGAAGTVRPTPAGPAQQSTGSTDSRPLRTASDASTSTAAASEPPIQPAEPPGAGR